MDNDPAMEDLSLGPPVSGDREAHYEASPPPLMPKGVMAGSLPDVIPLDIKRAVDKTTKSITIAGAKMTLSDLDELEGIRVGDQFILKEDRRNAREVPEWAKHATQIEVIGFIGPNLIALKVDGGTFEIYTLELANRDFDIAQAASAVTVRRAAAS